MSDETGEDKYVREGMERFAKMQRDRDELAALCANWERSHAILEHENGMLRDRVKDLEHQMAFYMRHSTELKTRLEGVSAQINDTLAAARDAAYRPTNSAPARVQAQPQLSASRERPISQGTVDDGEPAPKFLTQLEKDIRDITDTGKTQ